MLRTLATAHPSRRSPSLLRRITDAFALRRQRARLRDLSPHLMRDIGVTEEEAQAEPARPLWDIPPHWRG